MSSSSPPLSPHGAEEERDTRSDGSSGVQLRRRVLGRATWRRRPRPDPVQLCSCAPSSALDMQMDVRDMSKFFDESFDCAPVPLAQFDDTQLLSGEQIHPLTPCTVPRPVHAHRPLFFLRARAYYNLLEETSLVRESAHRILSDFGNNFGRNFEGRPDAKLLPSLALMSPA
ncbi:hypothetical protein ZWY2020_040655 [Hordeum vulgare]|nr:hypothetical protein ZWY2020_040655 [Hordeum vulgare]